MSLGTNFLKRKGVVIKMEDTREKSRYFEIPTLSYFESGNYMTGSANPFNYRIDLLGEGFHVKIWYGRLCSDLSEAAVASDFSGDENGYRDMILWLDGQYEDYRAKSSAGGSEA